MINIKTKIPGPKSKKLLSRLSKINGGRGTVYPFIHSKKGNGCYFKDIDNNTFLDFGCQIAVNPLGYNHPDMLKALKKVHKRFPIKYAGQDFVIKQHIDIIEEILSITPKKFNQAFIINSGAEAVENALKICLRKQKCAKIGISFERGWHGRTMGALSCTNSKTVQKKNYFSFNMRRLPYDENAGQKLKKIFQEDTAPEEIGFVILEGVQGEGGYNVAPKKMMQEIRKMTKKYKIPLICDEVQAGMGRTGKWWSYQHSDIIPDVQSCAKALQVGATISSKDMFPKEESSISSTFGGGDLISMTLGAETIKVIKKYNLLKNIKNMGAYLRKRLQDISEKHKEISNVRGLGLMDAFDMPDSKKRNSLILELIKNGIVLLGCGFKGVRVIPPYIVSEKEIDTFIEVLDKSLHNLKKRNFKQKGPNCNYLGCGQTTI
ncbi:MAG: aminotransferase class III-fold pyridoxal phosphate-dependent enzyme [Nanoarchaeota archaeon]|nr:aminotransferase class III-fold pyridoxal phosphate-dependent enzyme [Nanoarchaeota archaeon]